MNGTELVLWAGNRLPAGLDERLSMGRAGRFDAMSLFPVDVRRARADGTPATELAARAADAGVPVRVLDPFTRWLPRWGAPAGLDPDSRAFLDVDEEEFLTMAADLGVTSMSVIEPFGAPVGLDEATTAFAGMCDRAGDRGLRVHLEFLPWSAIPDLATAWAIVRGAARPNGGLVLDSWHFARSRSSLDLLAEVPGDRIFVVQLADGPVAAADDLATESNVGRLIPGRGAFDLPRLLAVLRATGALSSVGPEIFSPTFWAMPPGEAGDLARTATTALLGSDDQ